MIKKDVNADTLTEFIERAKLIKSKKRNKMHVRFEGWLTDNNAALVTAIISALP